MINSLIIIILLTIISVGIPTTIFASVSKEREDGSFRCAALYSICSSEEFRNEDFCIELCEEDPGWLGCRPRI